jgi:hypothetical protein
MGKIRRRPAPPEFIIRRVEDVPLTFLNDKNEQVKENFTLEFKSFTEFGALGLMQKLKDDLLPNGSIPYSALFANSITAIIDSDGEALTDDTGAPATLTREFFARLLPEDIEAINAAVRSDANPQTRSPAPGDSGSNLAASAAS